MIKSTIQKTIKHFSRGVYFLLISILISFQIANAQQFVNKGLESFGEISKSGLPPGWEYVPNTVNPHGVIVVLDANPRINDIQIKYGDYIGAFYVDNFGELKCGGADFWNGTENIIFPVFGDNPDTPEKDGFSYNEPMQFRIYYQDNQKDYAVTQIAWDPGYYSTNKWNPLGVSSAIDMLCSVNFDAFATVSANPLCVGQSVTLEAHIFVETTGNYTYTWTSEPPGLNSNLLSVTTTPQESTTYILEVSDGNNISAHQQHLFVYENPEVTSADTLTVCINQTAQLSAEALNFLGLIWTTLGDGTFTNPASIGAVYHPGNLDKVAGSASLVITVFPKSPCLEEDSDTTVIVLSQQATISVPAALEFCELEEMIFEAEAALYSGIWWVSSGDGTFSDPDSLVTQYFPGPSDLSINEFILTATAFSVTPCQGSTSDQVLVSTYNGPTLSAPSSRTVCATSAVNLNSVAFNYTTSGWETEGDGTFANPQMLNTTYFPGANDILSGGTTVTISAFGTGVCQESSVSKNILIVLKALPAADAGDDQSICHGGVVHLSGLVSNQSYLTWSSSGDGYFDNIYSATPTYFPGTNDFNSSGFSLILSAFANYPCTLPSHDTVEIEVLPEPNVEIGSNSASVCFGTNYYFDQVVANNYSSLNWFTINGTGTFDDNSILNPVYFPDQLHDFALGSIIVGISVQALEPCTTSADDYITLIMQLPPEVDAGSDFTMLEGQTFVPFAEAENYAYIVWTTSGDGTFDSNALLNPTYFPGPVDVNNYETMLMVVAEPIGSCSVSDSDQMTLSILNRQKISLHEGVQGISTYMDTEGKTFEELIAPVAQSVSFAQKFLQVYWPEYNINTFDDFEASPGCIIMLNADTALQLSGYRSENKTISLVSGWNILPVLSACNVSVQSLSDQLASLLIIITEIEGNKLAYPSEGIHSLEELLPGKSYLIKLSEAADIIFPECYE